MYFYLCRYNFISTCTTRRIYMYIKNNSIPKCQQSWNEFFEAMQSSPLSPRKKKHNSNNTHTLCVIENTQMEENNNNNNDCHVCAIVCFAGETFLCGFYIFSVHSPVWLWFENRLAMCKCVLVVSCVCLFGQIFFLFVWDMLFFFL